MCAQRRLGSDLADPGHPPSLIRVYAVRRKQLGILATQWVHSEDSDQTGWMPRLIGVFARRTGHYVGFVVRQPICLQQFIARRAVLASGIIWARAWQNQPVIPAKSQISLCIHAVWSESLLCDLRIAKNPILHHADMMFVLLCCGIEYGDMVLHRAWFHTHEVI